MPMTRHILTFAGLLSLGCGATELELRCDYEAETVANTCPGIPTLPEPDGCGAGIYREPAVGYHPDAQLIVVTTTECSDTGALSFQKYNVMTSRGETICDGERMVWSGCY